MSKQLRQLHLNDPKCKFLMKGFISQSVSFCKSITITPGRAYHGRHSAGVLEHALTVAEFKAWEKLRFSKHD